MLVAFLPNFSTELSYARNLTEDGITELPSINQKHEKDVDE